MIVALYCRVSTEEQVRYGLSVDAQIAALREWAERESHIVAGEYIDLGISARKPPTKRPGLQRLLDDLKRGGIKLIAFTKLDRFTRNVKGYYQVQDTLERLGVSWTAIHEDYETMTASGRFKTNIMLSVAENEADRTSERIKSVFQYKIAKGDAIYGKNVLPIGYTICGGKIVPDERAPVVKDAFENYSRNNSIGELRDYLQDQYGINIPHNSVSHLLKNRLYLGEYRDNLQYCEPIVNAALFDKVQRILSSRSVRNNQSNRIYLFSGITRCAVCGMHYTGHSTANSKGYRCRKAKEHRCTNRRSISERKIERYLCEHIVPAFDELATKCFSDKSVKRRKTPDVATINAKLSRLSDLYVEGLIDKQKYLSDREKLVAQLRAAQQNQPIQNDFTKLRKIVTGGHFVEYYESLKEREKREFWRSLIRQIDVFPDGSIRFYFVI